YESLVKKIEDHCESKGIDVECLQSNHEGDIVDMIQQAYFDKVDGIVINPGAYTHTSVAILDALKSVDIPAVEVHISDVSAREEFRQISYVSYYCFKTIMGEGLDGYIHAIDLIEEKLGADL
ncbi:MAG: 3-dehydroquinate dehydratase, partial [Clostridiales bacterium]|nr:3-dehydroquinate dehydratase [Clostridiales bacterium]